MTKKVVTTMLKEVVLKWMVVTPMRKDIAMMLRVTLWMRPNMWMPMEILFMSITMMGMATSWMLKAIHSTSMKTPTSTQRVILTSPRMAPHKRLNMKLMNMVIPIMMNMEMNCIMMRMEIPTMTPPAHKLSILLRRTMLFLQLYTIPSRICILLRISK